jgi:hypothetical protein
MRQLSRSQPKKQINESYVSRLLRLTLLAPEIVEAILNGSKRQR